MGNTDKSLIDAHLKGDTTAFPDLVRRYGDRVLGYLVRMTGNTDQAEDLFQETFRRVHEKANTFRGQSFKSWLFSIATNVAIDGLRRRRRLKFVSLDQRFDCDDADHQQLATLTSAEQAGDPAEESLKAEQKQQVRKAVESLPEKQRATLVLAYYQQLTYKEVAQVLGCSIGTVKTQMFRALKNLADKLPESAGVLK